MAHDPSIPEDQRLVEERRRHVRVPARIEVRFQESATAARVLKAYSLNFSVGGLCLRTRKEYPVGTSLQLSVTIEDQEYQLSGVVAWTRGDAIGVRFHKLEPEQQQRLTELVRSLET